MKYFLMSIVLLVAVSAPFWAQGADTGVIVNGRDVPAQQLMTLQRIYGVIRPGNYWYDSFSGLWGLVGGPTAGQIMPGLDIGGPLRPDASNGNTGVFINGRQLHYAEVLYLQQLGPVVPGRYWMNAQGIGGFEGGPPIFNLAAAAAARQRAQGGGPGYNRQAAGGSLMSDGNCAFFNSPNGSVGTSGC